MLSLSYCLYEMKYREGTPYFEIMGVTKNITAANTWLEGDKKNRRIKKFGEPFPLIEEVTKTDSLNPEFDSIKENSESSMKAKPKKEVPVKKAVVKHLKEDMKESRESIKEDKKLSKKMKKGKC